MIKKLSQLLVLWLFLSPQADACTLWASMGSVNKTAQLLFVKNRDAPQDSFQQLQLLSPSKGYRYLALMYKAAPSANTFDYISAGINQPGLTIGDSDIHTKAVFDYAVGSDIMRDVLQNYDSVAAVLQNQDRIFNHPAGQTFMIADREQIIMVEVDPDGHHTIQAMTSSGYVFHTNHFLDESESAYNDPVSQSTFMRYQRIGDLLAANAPFDQTAFERFAADQTILAPDGTIDTNNNILRKVTLATWLINIPLNGPPTLHLQMRNPKQPQDNITLRLDQAFWQQPS